MASHDDILTEILLRLPIRSLTRFKSVSKDWRNLISSRSFTLLRNPNPGFPSGLFICRRLNKTEPDYDFVPFDHEKPYPPPFKTLTFGKRWNSGILVLHASNGLMLCVSIVREYMQGFLSLTRHMYDDTIYVYNPTINQFITLPKVIDHTNIMSFEEKPFGMTLDFDPLLSPRYKVIYVFRNLRRYDLYLMKVYSSENGTWEDFSTWVSIPFYTEFMSGVYWNDTIHWIKSNGIIVYLKKNKNWINQMSTPPGHSQRNVKRHCNPLVKYRDSLLFIDVFPSDTTNVDVYEMIKDYSGWSIKYHVDIASVSSMFPNMSPICRPLLESLVVHCLVLGESEEHAFLVLEIYGKALRFNLVSKTYQKLCDFSSSRSFKMNDGYLDPWPGAFLFVESLHQLR